MENIRYWVWLSQLNISPKARAAVMRKDNRYPSATKIVRDIVPARKAGESMAEDDAGSWPRKLRRRNKHLPINRATLAFEHKRIELRQFRLARKFSFRAAANHRQRSNRYNQHPRIQLATSLIL